MNNKLQLSTAALGVLNKFNDLDSDFKLEISGDILTDELAEIIRSGDPVEFDLSQASANMLTVKKEGKHQGKRMLQFSVPCTCGESGFTVRLGKHDVERIQSSGTPIWVCKIRQDGQYNNLVLSKPEEILAGA